MALRHDSAHNPVLWAALQPALQLVSKVLASDHPMVWAWADVRKIRPIRDYRDKIQDPTKDLIQEQRDMGITRASLHALWPDFVGELTELSHRDMRMDELVEIYETGFDTTRYVCEIVARTLEWDIRPMYRMDRNRRGGEEACCGTTHTLIQPGSTLPFKITISIAAEYVWQLLVDEYSPAEKASVTFHLASVMLHELTVSRLAHVLTLCFPRRTRP